MSKELDIAGFVKSVMRVKFHQKRLTFHIALYIKFHFKRPGAGERSFLL